MVLHCACNLPGGLSMLSSTTISPSSLLTIQSFCTHFAPFCTVLPVLQGPSGEWVSVVAGLDWYTTCSFSP